MSPAGAPMVMTTLEARVEVDRWDDLRDAYRAGLAEPEPGLVETYLVQARNDGEVWRIVTLWRDAEALAAMRDAGTPRGVLMFRAAGAEPALLVADVAAHLRGEPR